NKTNQYGDMTFDTEFDSSEKIVYDNIEYIYYKDNDGYNGLLWNYADYQYSVDGNIDKDDLIKIAENLK
ncbi:MAG: DUF4367 domain-containing protein, partial [Eubacterium sp.]